MIEWFGGLLAPSLFHLVGHKMETQVWLAALLTKVFQRVQQPRERHQDLVKLVLWLRFKTLGAVFLKNPRVFARNADNLDVLMQRQL